MVISLLWPRSSNEADSTRHVSRIWRKVRTWTLGSQVSSAYLTMYRIQREAKKNINLSMKVNLSKLFQFSCHSYLKTSSSLSNIILLWIQIKKKQEEAQNGEKMKFMACFYYFFISFTLYPAHCRVGQGEPSVKTLRSPLSAEFWRHCVWVAELSASTPERRNENKYVNKYFTSSNGDRTHNQLIL